ncbi:MAG: septal ring lytic transglycosylase RlpA family protein [Treponema sp.]|jgi:rare lipoprotein A|nr:septal ring lytic transglycosylase RlpA family protein [Treponema sp.]
MKRIISLLCTGLAVCSLCIPQDAGSQVQPGPEGEIFRQEGIASWYGTEFDGRPTASGEIFNSALFTAAHPALPFGTVLIITNKHNNKKVTVTVNDRGPFVSARIIDVSKAAAEQLDMLVTGTAPVLVESAGEVVLPPGTGELRAEPAPPRPWNEMPAFQESQTPALTAAPAPAAAPDLTPASPQAPPAIRPVPAAPESLPPAVLKPAIVPAANKTYRLQVGSYRIARNAVAAFEKLKNAGLNPAYERNGEFFRVVLAGVRAGDVLLTTEKLGAAGFREALIREE